VQHFCTVDNASFLAKLAAGSIYRWTGSGWDCVPGSLSRISVSAGGKRVVGINQSGEIFIWQSSTWIKIPGSLMNIDVADSHLVGTNSSMNIFHIAL
jgi:hypothetical protein